MEFNLSAAQIKEIRDAIDQSVAMFIQNLPQRLAAKLEEAVAGTIGMRAYGGPGKWTVDSFAKDSMVGQLLSTNIRAAITGVVGKIGADFKIPPGMKSAIEREYARLFENEVHSMLYSMAREKASEFVKRISEAFRPDLGKIVIPPIDDPTSGDTAIGTVILEQVAKKIAEG